MGPYSQSFCEIRKYKATSRIDCVMKSCTGTKVFAFLCHSAVIHALQRDRVGPLSQLEQEGRRRAGGDLTSPLSKGKWVRRPHLLYMQFKSSQSAARWIVSAMFGCKCYCDFLQKYRSEYFLLKVFAHVTICVLGAWTQLESAEELLNFWA